MYISKSKTFSESHFEKKWVSSPSRTYLLCWAGEILPIHASCYATWSPWGQPRPRVDAVLRAAGPHRSGHAALARSHYKVNLKQEGADVLRCENTSQAVLVSPLFPFLTVFVIVPQGRLRGEGCHSLSLPRHLAPQQSRSRKWLPCTCPTRRPAGKAPRRVPDSKGDELCFPLCPAGGAVGQGKRDIPALRRPVSPSRGLSRGRAPPTALGSRWGAPRVRLTRWARPARGTWLPPRGAV